MIRVLLLTVMVTLATPVEADEITERANAVDSTVIEVDGQRIMLFGIDSVMRKQSCTIGGKIWQCWTSAMRGLQTMLDQWPVTSITVESTALARPEISFASAGAVSVTITASRSTLIIFFRNETELSRSSVVTGRAIL